jgi:hypothetical protein
MPESPIRTAFIDRIISDKGRFLDFVGNFMFIQRSQTAGSYLVETNQKFDSKGFLEFVDMLKIKKFIKDLTEDSKVFFLCSRLEVMNNFLINSEKVDRQKNNVLMQHKK